MPPTTLSDSTRSLIDQLFDLGARTEQYEAIRALGQLPESEKSAVSDYLVARLATEQEPWLRAWTMSALAELRQPGAADVVAAHLDPDQEDFEWARYWAAIALAKLQPPDLEARLTAAAHDASNLVQAEVARLLGELGHDDSLQQLAILVSDADQDKRWAACKALRRGAGTRPLSRPAERMLIPLLVERLNDGQEWNEIQLQAALAVGDVEHEWDKAIQGLFEALQSNESEWVKRICVDALARIARPECKDGLMLALRDPDAEIRVRAARGLKECLGDKQATTLIVDALLQCAPPRREYFDALREINWQVASESLAGKLLHPDPSLAERANEALVRLGGHEALRALYGQRTKAVEVYTSLLGNADKQVMTHFDGLMSHAKAAFIVSMCMHGIIFAVGTVILAIGLAFALAQNTELVIRVIGAGTAASSLAALVAIFYRDPLTNIRNSVTNLVKVNIIFLGYIRQINQTDATFKQLFLSASGSSVEQMKATANQIHDSVAQTMEQVKKYLES